MVDQRSHEAESWYAVHCQPHKERLVVSQLSDQLGLAVYLPEVKRRRHGRTMRAPFFPRYLFVRADLRTPEAGRINCTPGVVRLVGASGEALRFAGAVVCVPRKGDKARGDREQGVRDAPGGKRLLFLAEDRVVEVDLLGHVSRPLLRREAQRRSP